MLKYRAFGVTSKGATHIKNGLPNQDALKSYVAPNGEFAIITVCDGHGSRKYMRSNIGAKIAAVQTTNLIKEFMEREGQLWEESLQLQGKDDSLSRLKKNILYYWQQKVHEFTEKNPFTPKEEKIIRELNIDKASTTVYGTTLVTILLTQKYVLCLQIGDGDIIFLKEDKTLVNVMQSDKRLIANETTSLCGDGAIHDFRQYISSDLPSAVLICTDGVSNSYVAYEDFTKLAKDVYDELSKSDEKVTVQLLERGLERMSANGSGDDVTLAFAYQSF